MEVRDGRVVNYSGQYDAYLYKVNKEIEAGERELASARTKLPAAVAKAPRAPARPAQKNERDARKEIKALERTVAQLDEQKRAGSNAQLQTSTDCRRGSCALHNEISALTDPLAEAEERWCQLQGGGD